jgi:hypothetical protein
MDQPRLMHAQDYMKYRSHRLVMEVTKSLLAVVSVIAVGRTILKRVLK